MEILTYIKTAWNFLKNIGGSKKNISQTKLIDNTQNKNIAYFGNSSGNINLKDMQGNVENITTIGHITHNTYAMGEEEAIDLINRIVGKDVKKLIKKCKGFTETIETIKKNSCLLNEKLSEIIRVTPEKIDKYKQYQPDVQYKINNALISGIRKGVKVDLEILAKLVVEKMGVTSTDIFDAVIDLALEVITDLSHMQIQFLTLVFWMRDIKLYNITEETFNNYFKQFFTAVNIPGFSLSNIGYMQSKGTLQFHFLSTDIYEQFKKNYNFLPEKETDLDKIKYKEFIYFLEHYKKLTAGRIELLPAGKLIAAIHIEKILNQKIEYKTWIN